jgi:anion-transporting  ArsA/GET3 family ATPase
MRWVDLFEHDIVLMSGKGGTGKSSLAAALATVASASGRKVLLAEMEGRGEIVRSLGVADPGAHEVRVREGLSILSMTPHQAARDYIRLYMGLDRVAPKLLRPGALDQLVGVAPGFRDLLIAGKLYELTRERRSNPRDLGKPVYDLVVVDGPPTGQVAAFLEAPSVFAELVRVGRIKGQASAIARMLRERLAVVLVTVLEEMAIAETLEAVASLGRLRIPLAAVVANRCADPVVPHGIRSAFRALRGNDVASIANEAGLALSPVESGRLLEAAVAADTRHRQQSRFLRELRAMVPALVLPDVASGSEPSRVAALTAEISGTTAPNHDSTSAVRPRVDSHRSSARPFDVAPSLQACLDGARIVVVCGSGGVGKTTISAAVAIHFAELGRRTVLLTVDPARRLATALRLPVSAGERTEIAVGRRRRLEAIQLDTQRTFDDLVSKLAGSSDRRDRILNNPFYRRIADTLNGTHEYMAMEKLYELSEEEDHDLVVIDTPPTRSALSFLEAPKRLTDFLGGRLLRWMLWPSARAGRLTLSVARFGATAFAKTVGRLVGAEVLGDTAQFLASFEGMYGDFKGRADRVRALLQSTECVFILVAAPDRGSLAEALIFLERLTEGGMHPSAVVVNRWPGVEPVDSLQRDPQMLAAAISSLSEGGPEQRAVAAVMRVEMGAGPRVRVAEEAVRTFCEQQPKVPIVMARDLAEDVHDVRGLRRVARELFP